MLLIVVASTVRAAPATGPAMDTPNDGGSSSSCGPSACIDKVLPRAMTDLCAQVHAMVAVRRLYGSLAESLRGDGTGLVDPLLPWEGAP